MRAKSASDELASAGARRPILYLRSFEIDEDTSRPSILEFFGILLATSTPEQKLAQQLSRVGPVIAIGRPGEALPPLGAARFYVTDELWKQKVADVAAASRLVVWTSGVSEGLRWEISYLLRSLPTERLVLWAHPHLVVGRRGREAEWSLFLKALGAVSEAFSRHARDHRALRLRAGWHARPGQAEAWSRSPGPAVVVRRLGAGIEGDARDEGARRATSGVTGAIVSTSIHEPDKRLHRHVGKRRPIVKPPTIFSRSPMMLPPAKRSDEKIRGGASSCV